MNPGRNAERLDEPPSRMALKQITIHPLLTTRRLRLWMGPKLVYLIALTEKGIKLSAFIRTM